MTIFTRPLKPAGRFPSLLSAQRGDAGSYYGATQSRWPRDLLTFPSLLVGFFFSLLDTTIVSTSLLASSSDLRDFRDGSWVVLAYLLSFMG